VAAFVLPLTRFFVFNFLSCSLPRPSGNIVSGGVRWLAKDCSSERRFSVLILLPVLGAVKEEEIEEKPAIVRERLRTWPKCLPDVTGPYKFAKIGGTFRQLDPSRG
jgi:hypothetical protein